MRDFRHDESGATAVELALLSGVFVVLLGGGVEMGLAYHQHSAAEAAARHGARLASTGAPVTSFFESHTGLGGGTRAGDTLPDYRVECDGADESCTRGAYDANAMARLVRGGARRSCDTRDRNATRAQQGMCDFLPGLRPSNVQVAYAASGLGTAGSPSDPVPLVSVSVSGLAYDFVFLDRLFPNGLAMGGVTATVIAEDLRGGT